MMYRWGIGHGIHCDLWTVGRVMASSGSCVSYKSLLCGGRKEGEGGSLVVGLMVR